VNGDGWPDLVYSNGDGFNSGFAAPAPWHGLQWLENRGRGDFVYHRIGDMPGCYSPVCADLNGDGHMDIVAVSGFNQVNDPSSVWMVAWLNDGHEHFTPVPLARTPTRLITVAAGDLDGNGVPVLVTGGFHAYPPFNDMSRVTLWRRKAAEPQSKKESDARNQEREKTVPEGMQESRIEDPEVRSRENRIEGRKENNLFR
jgi:hypothetical protein